MQQSVAGAVQSCAGSMQAVYKTYIDVVHVKKSQTARTFTVAQPAADANASQVGFAATDVFCLD
jgi:hypothetical protein